MANPLDEFILAEYEQARDLTFHIDELRNKLTSFFLVIAGAGVAGLLFLLRESEKTQYFDKPLVVATLLFIIGIIGILFVLILAKIRKAQLEHFAIINNIRTYYVGTDAKLKNVLQLSHSTLPQARRTSGTYFWLLIVMIVVSFLLSTSIYLFTVEVSKVIDNKCGVLILLACFFVSIYLSDKLYFRMVQPPKQFDYSKEVTPINQNGNNK